MTKVERTWQLCKKCGSHETKHEDGCAWCRFGSRGEGGLGCSTLSNYKHLAIVNVALPITLRMSLGKERRFQYRPFWYVSLHSGASKNRFGVPCDTVDFLEQIPEFNRGFIAHVCDKEPDYLHDLESYVKNEMKMPTRNNTIYYHCMSNTRLLRKVDSHMRRREQHPSHALGCIVIDPNGPSLHDTPYYDLIWFSHLHPKMDYIWNINYLFFERALSFKKFPLTAKWLFKKPSDMLSLIPNKTWFVTPPADNNRNGYFTAIGRKTTTFYRPAGAYHQDSPEGKYILQWVDSYARIDGKYIREQMTKDSMSDLLENCIRRNGVCNG